MSSPPRSGSVSIENATGQHAHLVNGIYEPTEELSGGLPAYQKKCGRGGDMWLEYSASTWFIRKERGTKSCRAYNEIARPCLPHDCSAGLWHVNTHDSTYESSPALTATLNTQSCASYCGSGAVRVRFEGKNSSNR